MKGREPRKRENKKKGWKKKDMATNILYVTPQQNTAQAGVQGNPFRPYTLTAALEVLRRSNQPLIFWLSEGTYQLCGAATTITGQVSIYGASIKNTILVMTGVSIPVGSFVALYNLTLTSCPGTSVLLDIAGNLAINASMVSSNRGKFLNMRRGLLTLTNCNVELLNAFAMY